MLLSKDAIADVVEVVRATDFYKARPTRRSSTWSSTSTARASRPTRSRCPPSSPASARSGRVGGAPYLHTLLSSVPTRPTPASTPRIVAEQAVLRRLVEAGTRIVQLGYGAAGAGGVDDVVDRAQQSIYDVTERRSSEDYTLLEELMQPTMDELEAIGSRGGSMSGVPTGFADLDGLTNGLHPGQLIVIAGRPGLGKALALDTPLPTPTGWTTMGEVRVGDLLLDAEGPPDARRGGHGRDDRATVLRAALLRRHARRGRRGAPVAHAHPRLSAWEVRCARRPHDRRDRGDRALRHRGRPCEPLRRHDGCSAAARGRAAGPAVRARRVARRRALRRRPHHDHDPRS
jgi:hypothetical protein